MYSKIDEYLILYTDCIIVNGYTNTLIIDFTRPNNSNFIPNSLAKFLDECKQNSVAKVLKNLQSEEERTIAHEYIDFILSNEFGFFCPEDQIDNFINYPDKIDSPEYIDNCILEIDEFKDSKIKKIVSVFEELLSCSLEIRIKKINESSLLNLVQSFSNSLVQSINIYISDYSGNIDLENLNCIKNLNLRIKTVKIYNAIKNDEDLENEIFISKEPLVIDLNSRANVINISYHLEALKNNTYIYKKMFIGRSGEMKNYPEAEHSIGNIYETPIHEIKKMVESPIFQEKWFVPKSEILVCKACEYRTICFNSNIPDLNVNGEYYMSKECEYNPYIGKSKDEKGYMTLNESGIISNQKGFSINHHKLEEIKAELLRE